MCVKDPINSIHRVTVTKHFREASLVMVISFSFCRTACGSTTVSFHEDHAGVRTSTQGDAQHRAATRRTGIICPAYVYDDVQVFENILISRPNDLCVFKLICLLQQEAPQGLIAMKSSVVSAYLNHFAL